MTAGRTFCSFKFELLFILRPAFQSRLVSPSVQLIVLCHARGAGLLHCEATKESEHNHRCNSDNLRWRFEISEWVFHLRKPRNAQNSIRPLSSDTDIAEARSLRIWPLNLSRLLIFALTGAIVGYPKSHVWSCAVRGVANSGCYAIPPTIRYMAEIGTTFCNPKSLHLHKPLTD